MRPVLWDEETRDEVFIESPDGALRVRSVLPPLFDESWRPEAPPARHAAHASLSPETARLVEPWYLME